MDLTYSQLLDAQVSRNLKENYNFNQPKIFVIGLSRTATTSLDQALQILGFNTAHWVNPRTRKIVCLPDIINFDAVSDSCISFNFEYLAYLFPQSRFILTTREKQSWVKSVKKHFGLNSPQDFSQYYRSSSNNNSFYHRMIHQTLYANYQTWEEAYNSFYVRVSKFFVVNNQQSSRLLVINVCQGEGWEKLCPFVNKPIPSQAFPHANQAKK